jgi:aspartyl-tRNA(Asn)/glutamyl-tRNA(Gln) amidotransferase subunit A
MTRHAVATYQIIAAAEASSNLARYDGVRLGHRCADASSLAELQARSRAEGFGAEVKRRILLGTWVLSVGHGDGYFSHAQRVRTLICREFESAFSQCDVLFTPTTPTTAFAQGERTHDPIQMYLADLFTVSANLAGLPAISLPVGLDHDGLPIGMQLMAAPFAEERLLAAAQSLESLLPQLPEPPFRAAETQRAHSETKADV